ncbi:two-component system, sensor histidine kinase YesM [Paenibacillus sp. UNCCL117]|uniref:sensor histidine kinase n=1 Tax=unclassified Paenibacillus TaxID=185978 RepID=UPI00088337A6|nr:MULTISPECIES: sensor histidine kinase [unclassified Paenibacillus]SDC56076.1 two-component system, sensor histidine kinase YesM [Paenibacillus sp. cl123]SFW10855.1 two-component system, sensor histidine kinase YesM [Paenibacillus sp. UNCCL117]
MFKALARFVNSITIYNKLLLSYFVVVAIPVLLVGVMLTQSLREMALDNAIRRSMESVEKIRNRTNEIIRTPINISNEILLDKKLRRIVNTEYEFTYEVVKAYSEYTDFKDYLRLNKVISGIQFYTKNATMLNNWEFFYEDDQISSKAWFQDAMNAKGRIEWRYLSNETIGGGFMISLIRKIAFYGDSNYGMLVIGIDPAVFQTMLSEEPFETMLITDDGFVAAAKKMDLVGKTVDELNLNVMEEGLQGQSVIENEIVYNGKPSKVIVNHYLPDASQSGFKIVSIIPVQSIVHEANRISIFSFTIISISILIAVILILVFSNTLGRRLKKLSKEIKKVALGNLSAFSEMEGKDEIGQLSRQFNSMVSSIRDLMEEVSTANLQMNQLIDKQKEIKLKMLASQINPHFLFNTLETIRMKAHIRKELEIAHVVMLLGKLIRKNLEFGNDKIPLAEELENVQGYLSIQKFRYGDRLNFHVDVQKRAMSFKIFPLILQPLVENAVIHGLECKEDPCTIRIHVHFVDRRLQISVIDDGNGMESEQLERVVHTLNEPDEETQTHIGLRNVHQRIRLSDGEEYGLWIESVSGKGTRVTLHLKVEGEGYV